MNFNIHEISFKLIKEISVSWSILSKASPRGEAVTKTGLPKSIEELFGNQRLIRQPLRAAATFPYAGKAIIWFTKFLLS